MKVSDVDIEIIYKLLMSVPQSMELDSIDLTQGYNLRLSASTHMLDRIETENSMEELRELLKEYDKISKKRKRLQ